jgi:hypothetical protein
MNKLDEFTDKRGNDWAVRTYELSVAHGPDRNQWYETLVEDGPATGVQERYESHPNASNGHEKVCNQIRNGEYELEPVAYRLVMNDE